MARPLRWLWPVSCAPACNDQRLPEWRRRPLVMGKPAGLPTPLLRPGLGISEDRSPVSPCPAWPRGVRPTAKRRQVVGWQASSQGGRMALRTCCLQHDQLTGSGAIIWMASVDNWLRRWRVTAEWRGAFQAA